MRAHKRDRGFLPPRSAGCVGGPLRPRSPQWEVSTAAGSILGRVIPVPQSGPVARDTDHARRYQGLIREGVKRLEDSEARESEGTSRAGSHGKRGDLVSGRKGGLRKRRLEGEPWPRLRSERHKSKGGEITMVI
jgi:hypothetical protein